MARRTLDGLTLEPVHLRFLFAIGDERSLAMLALSDAPSLLIQRFPSTGFRAACAPQSRPPRPARRLAFAPQ